MIKLDKENKFDAVKQQGYEFSNLSSEDIEAITNAESKISSNTGKRTYLIAYSEKD